MRAAMVIVSSTISVQPNCSPDVTRVGLELSAWLGLELFVETDGKVRVLPQELIISMQNGRHLHMSLDTTSALTTLLSVAKAELEESWTMVMASSAIPTNSTLGIGNSRSVGF